METVKEKILVDSEGMLSPYCLADTIHNADGSAANAASFDAAARDHTHAPGAVGSAPTSHASSAAAYGVGTTVNYGHVKVTAGNGLAIASGAVSMAAASASAAGAVTTGAQTFAGAKTFSGAVVVSGQLTPGNPAVGTQAARRIYAGTGAMTDGVTALAQGLVYFQI